ncbi:MAG: deoxyguanosinetriphosphate triphosphohydrolase, partial [Gammaproteobacteria bacterium]
DLKHFLNQNLYRHYRVQRMSYQAERVVKELFAVFMENARLLPDGVQDRIRAGDESRVDAHRARMIADYIAGMTDRYAIAEYARLRDPRESGI